MELHFEKGYESHFLYFILNFLALVAGVGASILRTCII
jgi:hypothetical protein